MLYRSGTTARKQAKLKRDSVLLNHVNLIFVSCVQLFLPRVLVMYLIAGSAFLFYVTKIPERYFPGESVLSVIVLNQQRN